jgi:dihydroxyacetone kinase-like predicted kinase
VADDGEYTGEVPVKVSAAAVHKAVRNILANELNFDPEKFVREADLKARQATEAAVDAFDKKLPGMLDERLRYKISYLLEQDFQNQVKVAIKARVEATFNELIEETIAAYIKEGIELRVGWRQKVKVQLKPEEPK